MDGVCQTVAGVERARFSCDVLRETLRVSTFGRIRPGARVNLERALAAGGRLGGHIVNGHVDGTGTVTKVARQPLGIEIALAPELLKYLVPKGSVAVNGVSLTVGTVGEERALRRIRHSPYVGAYEPQVSEDGKLRERRDRHHREVRRAVSRTREEGRRAPVSVFSRIEDALEEIRRGRMLIVVDDEDRENEGDIIMAAEFVTPESINFIARHARGLICAALEEERADELRLGLMVQENTAKMGTPFTVSVDAVHGTTTGISAHDRAVTIRALIDPETRPQDLARPGHIFPLRAARGGVLRRAGHTEAAVDLTRLAGLKSAGVLCEIMAEDGSMARIPELVEIAKKHDLRIITICDLIEYRRRMEKLVRRVAEASLPTRFGEFKLVAFEGTIDGSASIALVMGEFKEEDADARARAFPVRHGGRFRFAPLRLRRSALDGARNDREGGDRRVSLHSAGGTRASASSTRSARTRCRIRGGIRSRRTSSSAFPPIFATTASARRSWRISAFARSGS